MTKHEIEKNWDKFLGLYYNQSCGGCSGGHPSLWKTIVESKEWNAWKKCKDSWKHWDFMECEEFGIMSNSHWNDFVKFIKKG